MSPSTSVSLRAPHRAVTMRTKLIAGIVGLIIVLIVVIGVVTEIFLSRYLVDQLDERLIVTQSRSPLNFGVDRPAGANSVRQSPAAPGSGGACNMGPIPRGPQEGLFICQSGGVAMKTVNWNDFAPANLTSAQVSAISNARPGASPITVDVPGLGSYRIVSQSNLESPGETLINGLSLREVNDTQARLAEVMAVVAGGAIILGGLIVLIIVRKSVRPLERVAATARQVATLPLHTGDVDLAIRVPDRDTDARTEIGSVGAAINQMLGHVSDALTVRQASEMRVRQFVADASHELRTPLAAIRGYAELARRGEHEPGAVAHALQRVERESARMTTLVDDLLLLAVRHEALVVRMEVGDLRRLAVVAVG